MAETARQLVVRLTLDAGGFKKAAQDIKGQVRLVDQELRGLGERTDQKVTLLSEKLGLQKQAVENYKGAVDQAKINLDNAATAADKLLAAKRLSTLETDLEKAKAAAEETAAKLRELDAMKFTNFGNAMTKLGGQIKNLGRKMSLYVTGPLLALGGKSYSVFKDQEDAFISMQKTVEETDTTSYEDLSAAMYELSETIPVSYEALMGLAQMAGAMGVSADDIEKVVENTARLSASIDGIDGETAAQQMAQILNITEKGPQNVDKFGAALVALGNNFPTLEGEILNFMDRTKNAGTLVGMSTAEILGMSGGFAAMGIRAEAGGTAASRVMQEMQKATELGGKAMKEFAAYADTAGMSARELQLEAGDSDWVKGTAEDMGKTTKEVKDMVGNMVQLEHFATLTGNSMEGFIQSWDASAADSILAFFQGLAKVNEGGGDESVITWLDKMGLDNVRIAQILQGASLNPELMAESMAISVAEYEKGMALLEESNKKFSTTLSQDEITMNKIENAGADIGANIAEAIDPAKKALDDLLTGFNNLSEVDQDRIVKVMGALIISGPSLWILGKTASFIGSLSTGFGSIIRNKDKIIGAFTAITSSPLFSVLAAGTALAALTTFVLSLPSDAELIRNSLANIEISIDENSKNETLAAIREVREEAEKLSGEKAETLKGTSAAVKAGYGTQATFGHALEYERIMAQREISQLSGVYDTELTALNNKIADAVNAGDRGLADSLAAQRDTLTSAYHQNVATAKGGYTQAANALVAGMMQAQPEAKAILEKAAQDYDLLAMVSGALKDAQAGKDMSGRWEQVFSQDVIKNFFGGVDWFTDGKGGLGGGSILKNPERAAAFLQEKLLTDLQGGMAEVNEGTLGFTLLNTLLGDPENWDMLDATGTEGALDGLIELMDLKGAAEKAKEDGGSLGENITQGIADGIDSKVSEVENKGTEIKDKLKKNIEAAFEMHSPSQLMVRIFRGVPEGMALGIQQAAPLVYQAMNAMGQQLIAQAAAMAAAISAAFAANINFSLPGVGGGGVPGGGSVINSNVTVNGPANASNIYKIQRGLTDVAKRAARGYGKG